ncbi:MAG TPA: hypothetical protein VE010_20905 [Thermoanaerobaculia bacterium]|nr:hypothetical protein [Thermoanaerobaculia bacterium]
MISERDHSTHGVLQRALRNKLVACALVAAFAALCLAAADALSLAVRVVIVAVIFMIAAALSAAYRNLPRHEQRRVLSQRTVARDVTVSAVLGIAIACTYWFGGWIPLRWAPDLVAWLWPKIDFIPSAFSLLLPIHWQSGFHHYFNDMTYCFPGPFWWETMRYLRTAIPAYAIMLFAVMTLVRLTRATFRVRPRTPRAYD